jgi:dipeptidyl-peptidase-4
MNKNLRHYISAAAVTMCATATAAPLTVADYCQPDLTRPVSVKTPMPLADGTSYSAISADGRSIESYSFKTGKKLETLFSLDAQKGDVKIDSFDGYSISDNGRKIMLWQETSKIYRHSFYAEYYVYDTFRGTMQRVSTGGPQRGATMSHDGLQVAYMRDNNLWISNLDYGTDKAITKDGQTNKVINGIPDWVYEEEFGMQTAMAWNGQDNVLAFIRFDESEVPVYSFDNYKSYCDADPLTDVYPESYSYKYPLAGYPNSTVTVLAYHVDNQTVKQMDIPIGKDYVPSMEFDGTGTNLMVMTLNRDQNSLKLYKVNPGSTISKVIYTETSDAWLSPSAYQMGEYGAKSFYIGSEKSGYRHLYEYDYNGNCLRQVTKGEWNVTNFYGCDPRTGTVYVQTTQLGPVNRNIAAVERTGKTTILNNTPGTENAWFSSDCRYFLRSYSNAVTPPVFTLCDSRGKLLTEVENNAQYAAKYASAPKKEFLQIPNAEGEMMDAFIIKPADFSASNKYPLLMYQYNGPDSQEVLNAWRMEGIYYLASQGYVVVAVDGRGTGNRSRQWATSVYRRLGQLETKDQLAGAKWMKQQSYIDPQRTACFGWSYGGYMTLMELGDPDCTFKAGVAMAPVTDWRFYDSVYTERYMTTPQQNESGYDAASALNRTQNLKGRLLIMSGTSDDNVHFYNTLKYTSKLYSQGTVFDMMALTGFEHSLPKCNARAMLFKKICDFLDHNVR